MKIFKWFILGCFCLGIVFYGFAQSNPNQPDHQPDLVNVGKIINGFKVIAFKKHKGNPTQTPVGTPTAIHVIGLLIIFINEKVNQGPTVQEIWTMENTLQHLTKSKLGAKSTVKCVADHSTGQQGMKCEVDIKVPKSSNSSQE